MRFSVRWTILLIAIIGLIDCKCSSKKEIRAGAEKADSIVFDLSRFDRDPQVQKMVFETRFSEIIRRFGDAVFEQSYTLEVSSGRQGVEISSSSIIEQSRNGDYHIKITNSADRLIDILYIDKKLYVSTDGKRYFLHSDDLTEARTKREDVYSQANTFFKTYARFIKFVPDQEVEIDGVRFIKYKTVVNPDLKKGDSDNPYSLTKIDGYILIDRRSGGLVGVDIKGEIKYDKGDRGAISRFSLKSGIKRLSSSPVFKVPEVGAEAKKLRIEKDLLNRLEKMEERVDNKEEEDQEDTPRK